MTDAPFNPVAWILERIVPNRSLVTTEQKTVIGVDEALAREIVTKAAGNPFFVEELAWSVAMHDDRHTALPLPDTVQAVLAARIDRLPAEEKQLLQTASVIGKDVPDALLAAIAEQPEETLRRGSRPGAG